MAKKQNGAANVAPSALLAALSTALAYPADGIDSALAPLRACAKSPSCARYASSIEAVLNTVSAFTAPGVAQPHGAEAAQLEYTRLFIGSFKMYAPPYASYYLDGEHQVQGPTTVEVASLYDQFGVELGETEHDCADHIRYLLAFTSLLARTYEERGRAEFVDAYRDFVELYVLRWAPEFARLVDDYAEFPLYPALVRLVIEVLSEEGSDA